MADDFDARYEAAVAAARKADETEPRSVAGRYDRDTGCFIVELNNGTTFMFPARLCQGLAGASDDDLAKVEVLPHGIGLHWEKLDVDLGISALLMGVFGSRRWMALIRSEMGRKGGSRTSKAKARAARENGKRGGRPRKSAGS